MPRARVTFCILSVSISRNAKSLNAKRSTSPSPVRQDSRSLAEWLRPVPMGEQIFKHWVRTARFRSCLCRETHPIGTREISHRLFERWTPRRSMERVDCLGCDRNISTINDPTARVVLTVIEPDPRMFPTMLTLREAVVPPRGYLSSSSLHVAVSDPSVSSRPQFNIPYSIFDLVSPTHSV